VPSHISVCIFAYLPFATQHSFIISWLQFSLGKVAEDSEKIKYHKQASNADAEE